MYEGDLSKIRTQINKYKQIFDYSVLSKLDHGQITFYLSQSGSLPVT